MKSTRIYTFYGVLAILLWSAVLNVARVVTEQLGILVGATAIYTVAAVMLLLYDKPKLNAFSIHYVTRAGTLFVLYELCLIMALGLALSRFQASQVLIINYLWPAFTILFAIMLSKNKPNILLFPALLLAFGGVVITTLGQHTSSLNNLYNAFEYSTQPYLLAFIGAILWAIYCNFTRMRGDGKNAISLFFTMTALTLWGACFIVQPELPSVSIKSLLWLAIAGIGMGAGYAFWNKALIGGNMILLATFSYFTPILSAAFGTLILGVTLPNLFWIGVLFVCVGSLISWKVISN